MKLPLGLSEEQLLELFLSELRQAALQPMEETGYPIEARLVVQAETFFRALGTPLGAYQFYPGGEGSLIIDWSFGILGGASVAFAREGMALDTWNVPKPPFLYARSYELYRYEECLAELSERVQAAQALERAAQPRVSELN